MGCFLLALQLDSRQGYTAGWLVYRVGCAQMRRAAKKGKKADGGLGWIKRGKSHPARELGRGSLSKRYAGPAQKGRKTDEGRRSALPQAGWGKQGWVRTAVQGVGATQAGMGHEISGR